MFVLLTASCVKINNNENPSVTTVTEKQTVEITTTEFISETATQTEPETTTEQETETSVVNTTATPTEHSRLYIEGISADLMAEYFAETVLSAE
ncbi:MAG: hypothetical protein IJM10_00320, partial [Clostridia bacterium]|nr:hypothetical protein [Clostridia bacterium]